MSSVISSASKAISTSFDTVTDVAGAIQMSVSMATTYVDNRAKRQTVTDREQVMLETAKDLALIKADLDADANLKAIFDKLDETW